MYPLLIQQVVAWSNIVQSIALSLDIGVVRRGAGHSSTVWSGTQWYDLVKYGDWCPDIRQRYNSHSVDMRKKV